jgi:hypothetical protein
LALSRSSREIDGATMLDFRNSCARVRGSCAAVLLSALFFADRVHAESAGGIDHPVPEADRTTELAMGVGNHLGIGRVDGTPVRLQDLSGGGTTLELAVGYRVTSAALLGVYVTGSRLAGGDSADQDSNVMTSSAGLQVNWHGRPAMLLDPWIGYGAGWRGIWLRRASGVTTSQGLDVARLQVGLDFRLASSFALSPVIGADWSLELWDDGLSSSSRGARINALVFAGVLGRVQMFGP